MQYAIRAFCGSLGVEAAETNRYVSPASLGAHASFVGFPKTMIVCGGLEIFIDGIRTLRDKVSSGP